MTKLNRRSHLPPRGAIFTMIGGVLIHLTIGTLYSFGNMSPYIVSYMREAGVSPNLEYETASIIFAVAKFSQGPGMFLGGFLERKIGMHLTCLAGCLLFCFATLISYLSIQTSFVLLTFTYGFLFGFGIGLAYIPPMVGVMKWFPQSKGFVAGMLCAGFGAGALIFNFVQTVFINPTNLAPNIIMFKDDGTKATYYGQESVLEQVPSSFFLQGGLFLAIELIGIALLREPSNDPSHKGNSKSEASEATQLISCEHDPAPTPAAAAPTSSLPSSSTIFYDTITTNHRKENVIEDSSGIFHELTDSDQMPSGGSDCLAAPTTGDDDARWSGQTLSAPAIFRTTFFWQLSIAMLLDGLVVVYAAALYKAYGQTFIKDDFFLAAVGSVSSAMNAAGRIFWGTVADKYSFKTSFTLLSGIMSIFLLTYSLTPYAHEMMFLIWTSCIFFCIGGIFSCAPVGVSRAFGSTHVGINYGFAFLLGVSAGSVAGAILEIILQNGVPWETQFIVIGVCPAMGMIVALFIDVRNPEGKHI